MRNKVVLVGGLLLMLAIVLFSKGYKQGIAGEHGVTNPMSQYSTIAELQASVDFDFKVPSIIANGKNLLLYNYMNNMVEIQSDEFIFRAAPHIGEGADISGDYNEYPVDNLYTGDGVSLRYRGMEGSTIINLTAENIDYSIKFNREIREEDAFNAIEIGADIIRWDNDENQKNSEVEQKEIENIQNNFDNEQKGIENEQSDIENNLNNLESTLYSSEDVIEDNNEMDVKYVRFKDEKMGVSFLLPEIKNEIESIYADGQLAIMINKKVIFVLEKYENGYILSDFSGQSIVVVNEQYIIRYNTKNAFEEESEEYKDYCTIIDNIEIVAETFKEL